jgi:type II secretory pathway component PulF
VILPGRRLEEKAERLADLASALDAGLDPAGLVTDLDGADGLADAIAKDRRFHVDEIDRRVLDAAGHAGEIPAALRERSTAARDRALLVRDVARRVAYPITVLVGAYVLMIWLYWIGLTGIGPLTLALAGGVLVAIVLVIRWGWRRARTDPGFTGARVPGLEIALRDAGELPYLTALRGLHAAGVLLADAHEIALRAVPIASVRGRLFAATAALRGGAGFIEALTAQRALTNESVEILTTAERAGELETGLTRAAERRRTMLERRLQRTARVVGGVVYAIACLTVLWIVVDFYGGLYSRLGGRR